MSEADQHLLKLIQTGDREGWNQFIARFQRRLIAYASRQVDQAATAEDLVQETFIDFLKGMERYREECELESFLFQILRRRIVDHYRRQGRNKEIPACSFRVADSADAIDDPLSQAASSEMHASWYARQNESRDGRERALAVAVRKLASNLQNGEKFRDLKIAEGLFYAGRRNKELAIAMGVSEQEVSLVKHRLIKRLNQLVRDAGSPDTDESADEDTLDQLLTSVWESQRPSCPKRTTLGKFLLGILPADWDDFVDFHVNMLGCTFCNANLAELHMPRDDDASCVNDRLFSSTVGFLNRPT